MYPSKALPVQVVRVYWWKSSVPAAVFQEESGNDLTSLQTSVETTRYELEAIQAPLWEAVLVYTD